MGFVAAPILVLDEGHQSFDGLAMAVAIFGRGAVELLYVYERDAVRRIAARVGAAVAVVDIDREANPKDALAEIEADDDRLRLAILTEGTPAVQDAALAVGTSTCLLKSVPAEHLVRQLARFAGDTSSQGS